MTRGMLSLLSILAMMAYGSPAESKPRLIDRLVVALEKIPDNKWEVNHSSAEIRLRIKEVSITISENGLLCIKHVSIVFDRRLRKIYKKIVKHKYKDLLMLKALKALGKMEGKQNVSGTPGTQHRKP